jgi:hypothetical protein
MHAYFGQKPSTKADTANLLRPIREAGAERESGGKETSKEGISRSEHAPVSYLERETSRRAQKANFGGHAVLY